MPIFSSSAPESGSSPHAPLTRIQSTLKVTCCSPCRTWLGVRVRLRLRVRARVGVAVRVRVGVGTL